MRHWIGIVLALALAGCGPPNPAVVGGQAQAALEKQLKADYPKAELRVEKIDVVAVDRPKYEGDASIKLGPIAFTVPVAVTSDGKTTLVKIDKGQFEETVQAAYRRYAAVLDGKYSDYILSPTQMAVLPASLRSEPGDFKERLETVMPVKSLANWYFGEGCMAHTCGSEMAAWVVNKTNGRAVAVVMKAVGEPGSGQHSFRLYGSDVENLPEPLREWGSENGMTYMNVTTDPPEYVSPGK